jgi:hypothetical protein
MTGQNAEMNAEEVLVAGDHNAAISIRKYSFE